MECGRPHDGTVANIMRSTRAAYHYAVQFVKKNTGQTSSKNGSQELSLMIGIEIFGEKRKKYAVVNLACSVLSMVMLKLIILLSCLLTSMKIYKHVIMAITSLI